MSGELERALRQPLEVAGEWAERKLAEVLEDPRLYPAYRVRYSCLRVEPPDFVRLLSRGSFALPVYAVVCPGRRVGAIYWVARDFSSRRDEIEASALLTRTTYGYSGSGVHSTALVLAALRRLGVWYEVRGGDCLLSLLYESHEEVGGR